MPNECMKLFPGLVSNPIHLRKALKMCALPSVKASLRHIMPSLCCRNLAPADRVASKRQSSAHICERIASRSPEEIIVRLHRSLAPSATIQLELASMANVFKNESYPLLKNVESAPRLLRRVVVPVMPSTKIKMLPGLYRRSNSPSPPLFSKS